MSSNRQEIGLPELTLEGLKSAASSFAESIGAQSLAELYGVTDGKAVGTYIEQAFTREYLTRRFRFLRGNSASGIDLPELNVDIKVTSIRKPQSSCPFRDASQKVYGLGYHLLVFVYEKKDDEASRTSRLRFVNLVFIDSEQTGDYQTTKGLLDILDRNGNEDDVAAFLEERNLPLEEVGRSGLARRIINERPHRGYLTISPALQWRLQYRRVVELAEGGETIGIENLLKLAEGSIE